MKLLTTFFLLCRTAKADRNNQISAVKLPSYWICKSEPSEYSISKLEMEGKGRWDGVRNFQARNFIRSMKLGDVAYFYHSNCLRPGIYGSMVISSLPYPDPTALDSSSEYFDKKATTEKNPWASVDVSFQYAYENPLLLSQIKTLDIGQCPLTTKGNRLSIIPLTEVQHIMIKTELDRLN